MPTEPPWPAVMLVEDNPMDLDLTLRALALQGFGQPILTASDGEQALARLQSLLRCHALPGLILLDLDLPGLSGLELLQRIKSDLSLAHVPTVVLSASTQAADLRRAYRLGANSYLVKPDHFTALLALTRQLGQYWCQTNQPWPVQHRGEAIGVVSGSLNP